VYVERIVKFIKFNQALDDRKITEHEVQTELENVYDHETQTYITKEMLDRMYLPRVDDPVVGCYIEDHRDSIEYREMLDKTKKIHTPEDEDLDEVDTTQGATAAPLATPDAITASPPSFSATMSSKADHVQIVIAPEEYDKDDNPLDVLGEVLREIDRESEFQYGDEIATNEYSEYSKVTDQDRFADAIDEAYEQIGFNQSPPSSVTMEQAPIEEL